MMIASSLKIEQRGGIWYLAGVIDEYADLAAGLAGAAAPLHLNLAGVTRMNSVGIRNFLIFLKRWGQKPLVYEGCPVEFVDQVMLIPALLGFPKETAVISSLYVPYLCGACGQEADLLVLRDDLTAGKDQVVNFPEQKCQHCSSVMSVEPDHYGRFLLSA